MKMKYHNTPNLKIARMFKFSGFIKSRKNKKAQCKRIGPFLFHPNIGYETINYNVLLIADSSTISISVSLQ